MFGTIPLVLGVFLGACHPEAVAGAAEDAEPVRQQESSSSPPEGSTDPQYLLPQESEAEPAPPPPVSPRSTDELIDAGETGLLPLLVPGVGPLTNPGNCNFDDPFSSCQ